MSRHKNIIITLPEPCNENWEQMTPSGCGRFCSSCQKTVTDFTNMTDKEIVRFYEQHEHICGRFLKNQLNRKLVYDDEKRSTPFKLYHKIAAALLIANTFVYEAIAKQKEATETTATSEQRSDASSMSAKGILKGIVLDQDTQLPIAGIEVVVKNVSGNILAVDTTDEHGTFLINSLNNFTGDSILLSATAATAVADSIMKEKFIPEEMIIFDETGTLPQVTLYAGKIQQLAPINIVASVPTGTMLGGIVSVSVGYISYRPTLWQRVSMPLRKLFRR